MRIKLADAVKVQKTIEVTEKPDLYAAQCDGCGKVFELAEFCNERGRGVLHGTFERCASDPKTGKGMGNGFNAHVCSFKCAHEIFANGGWRKLEEYKPFADADIQLGRADVTLTRYTQDETEIRRSWATGQRPRNRDDFEKTESEGVFGALFDEI